MQLLALLVLHLRWLWWWCSDKWWCIGGWVMVVHWWMSDGGELVDE